MKTITTIYWKNSKVSYVKNKNEKGVAKIFLTIPPRPPSWCRRSYTMMITRLVAWAPMNKMMISRKNCFQDLHHMSQKLHQCRPAYKTLSGIKEGIRSIRIKKWKPFDLNRRTYLLVSLQSSLDKMKVSMMQTSRMKMNFRTPFLTKIAHRTKIGAQVSLQQTTAKGKSMAQVYYISALWLRNVTRRRPW